MTYSTFLIKLIGYVLYDRNCDLKINLFYEEFIGKFNTRFYSNFNYNVNSLLHT